MKKIIMAIVVLTTVTACSVGASSADKEIAMLAGKALFIRDYIKANNALKIIKDGEFASFRLIKPLVITDPNCKDTGGKIFCDGYSLEFIKDMRQNADRKKDGLIDRSTAAYEDCFRITASKQDRDGKYLGLSYTTYITADGDKPFYDTCSAKKVGQSGKACEKLGGRLNDVTTWTTVDYDVPADKAAQIKRVAI